MCIRVLGWRTKCVSLYMWFCGHEATQGQGTHFGQGEHCLISKHCSSTPVPMPHTKERAQARRFLILFSFKILVIVLRIALESQLNWTGAEISCLCLHSHTEQEDALRQCRWVGTFWRIHGAHLWVCQSGPSWCGLGGPSLSFAPSSLAHFSCSASQPPWTKQLCSTRRWHHDISTLDAGDHGPNSLRQWAKSNLSYSIVGAGNQVLRKESSLIPMHFSSIVNIPAPEWHIWYNEWMDFSTSVLPKVLS